MSVCLEEVLQSAGYDVRNNIDDAKWLFGQEEELNQLCEEAECLIDQYDVYQDFCDTCEDFGCKKVPTWEEWRAKNE